MTTLCLSAVTVEMRLHAGYQRVHPKWCGKRLLILDGQYLFAKSNPVKITYAAENEVIAKHIAWNLNMAGYTLVTLIGPDVAEAVAEVKKPKPARGRVEVGERKPRSPARTPD